jgi:hypothetical protein
MATTNDEDDEDWTAAFDGPVTAPARATAIGAAVDGTGSDDDWGDAEEEEEEEEEGDDGMRAGGGGLQLIGREADRADLQAWDDDFDLGGGTGTALPTPPRTSHARWAHAHALMSTLACMGAWPRRDAPACGTYGTGGSSSPDACAAARATDPAGASGRRPAAVGQRLGALARADQRRQHRARNLLAGRLGVRQDGHGPL